MKNLRKYLVFPITYLILELLEEFLYYKSELIEDVWVRTAVLMTALVAGISLLAFLLVPFFEGGLETLHKSHKKHGPFADFAVTLLLLAALYYVYYVKLSAGSIKAILPPFMLN